MTDENVVSPWQKHFNKQIGRGWVDLVNPYEDDDFGYDDEPDYVDEDTYRLLQEMERKEVI